MEGTSHLLYTEKELGKRIRHGPMVSPESPKSQSRAAQALCISGLRHNMAHIGKAENQLNFKN